MDQELKTNELKATGYEVFILLVSILSVFNLFMQLIPGISTPIKGVMRIVDGLLLIIFITDFLYRFFTAESKSNYFFRRWGWADLLASLPFPQARIFRMFRIIRVLRLLRTYGVRNMMNEVIKDRAGSALYLTLFTVIMLIEFGGIAILYAEIDAPGASITTAPDAVWWGIVTITTVGYGDYYPVTESGRLIAIVIMVVGLSLFGVLTGFLATVFVPDDDPSDEAQTLPESGSTTAQLSEVRRLLAEQEKLSVAIRAQLAQLEGAGAISAENNPTTATQP
jgi:voltage-gated potassium channel